MVAFSIHENKGGLYQKIEQVITYDTVNMEMFAKLYFCPFNSQFKIEQIQMYQIIFDYNGDLMN